MKRNRVKMAEPRDIYTLFDYDEYVKACDNEMWHGQGFHSKKKKIEIIKYNKFK